jgi:hypothetical protein
MRIAETYSHLNGLEFLIVHKPALWKEIQDVIAAVDAGKCKTKVSKEKTMRGELLFSPIEMNAAFKRFLHLKKWDESRVSYWVTFCFTKEEPQYEITLGALPAVLCCSRTDLPLRRERSA